MAWCYYLRLSKCTSRGLSCLCLYAAGTPQRHRDDVVRLCGGVENECLGLEHNYSHLFEGGDLMKLKFDLLSTLQWTAITAGVIVMALAAGRFINLSTQIDALENKLV